MGYAVRTAKDPDRMCAGSGGRRCGLPDGRLSALGEERPDARMFGGCEVQPVPRTGAAQARLTSGISGERSESAACRG
jgi:hypothetical protein